VPEFGNCGFDRRDQILRTDPDDPEQVRHVGNDGGWRHVAALENG
jgi:hypothetical protein